MLLVATVLTGPCVFDAAAAGADAPVQTASVSAADIPTMDVNGLTGYLDEHKGKPTFIVMWTTWCPSCKQQLPWMEQLQKTHGDKVNILALALDDKKEAVVRYFNKKKMLDVPVYWGSNDVAATFKVQAVPTMVVFTQDTKVVFNDAGIVPYEQMVKWIDQLYE